MKYIFLFVVSFISTSELVAQQKNSLFFNPDLFKRGEDSFFARSPYDTIKNLMAYMDRIPKNMFIDSFIVKNDSITVKSLSKTLRSAHENIYAANNSLNHNYRFTWLRSFDKQIIIKVYEKEQHTIIETKWISKKGIDNVKRKILPLSILDNFEELLTKNGFWNDTPALLEKGYWIDGSSWILEGNKNNNYHFLYRHSPDKQSSIAIICSWLIIHSDAAGEYIN